MGNTRHVSKALKVYKTGGKKFIKIPFSKRFTAFQPPNCPVVAAGCAPWPTSCGSTSPTPGPSSAGSSSWRSRNRCPGAKPKRFMPKIVMKIMEIQRIMKHHGFVMNMCIICVSWMVWFLHGVTRKLQFTVCIPKCLGNSGLFYPENGLVFVTIGQPHANSKMSNVSGRC